MVLFSSLEYQPEKGSTPCTCDWSNGQSGVILENRNDAVAAGAVDPGAGARFH